MSPIKFSENTMTILKNFSSINTGLFFRKGNILRTINEGKSIFAEATIDEDIPQDFGIHNLSQLLAVLSLHKETPSITMKGNEMVVAGYQGRSKITYRACDPTTIKTPGDKSIATPKAELSFLLSETDLNWIMRSTGVLASPHIAVVGNGKNICLQAVDARDNSAHTDSLEMEVHAGEPFRHLFIT